MHEFHAWIKLAESAEESDLGQLTEKVIEVRDLAADSDYRDAVFEVKGLNGAYFFSATGLINHRRDESDRLELFLAVISRRLPGSFGLVYERDDETPDPPGPNAFRVRVIARGKISERQDPFLSPCNPVIED
jgi:Immunity protein 7